MRAQPIFLGSHVAQRVFWLFVLCALLPLAFSDWLATSAVAELARSLEQRSQVQSTRQTALKVFDRLVTAKTALLAIGDRAPSTDADNAEELAPVSRIFSTLVRIDATAPQVAATAQSADLVAAWQRAGDDAEEPARSQASSGRDGAQVTIRIAAAADGVSRVLMDVTGRHGVRWISELRSSFLWQPLEEAAIDGDWVVTDEKERVLARQGDSISKPATRGQVNLSDEKVQVYRTSLFLGGEFQGRDWAFAQTRLAPDALWHGVPLGGWLALVAAATVLIVVLVGVRQIRLTLVPLEQLTEGTRRIASGASSTRVTISGSDEFAALGNSFNEMAVRIEAQIRSLENLASIDRDVLAGSPIDSVVQRVLAQLRAAHPEVSATVLYLDGDDGRPQRLIDLGASGSAALTGRPPAAPLSTAEVAQIEALLDDDVLETNSVHPLSWILRGRGEGEAALLPLRWGAGTQALLVVGSPTALGEAAMKASRELRDRLAVAFSARAREREMAHRASHDSLTGLANRHGLNEFVDAMLRPEGSLPNAAAVLFVDLDNFKDANDSLGHEIGDEVLGEAGRRLMSCGPSGALVARQGGDEFVLVLPSTDESGARVVAAEAVRRLAEPFRIGKDLHALGASIGIALFPAHGRNRQELLRRADIAMYAAKAAGRSRYALFDHSLELATQRRLQLRYELRRALDVGELVAHYQPRVCPRDGGVTSAEALVRWNHPERGLLMPDAFIPIAEESELIGEIGLFMLNDACSRVVSWQRSHPRLQRISVNLSPRQLAGRELPGVVRAVLARHSVDPKALELEVTENLLVDKAHDAYAQLAELRRLGVSIALDDFGTGYSAMTMLRDLPIDVMKIDRAFVKDLDRDPSAVAIARTIATLAHELNLYLVAEGVETASQAKVLGGMGCDELQGYLYAAGLPAEAFDRFCGARTGTSVGDGQSLVPGACRQVSG